MTHSSRAAPEASTEPGGKIRSYRNRCTPARRARTTTCRSRPRPTRRVPPAARAAILGRCARPAQHLGARQLDHGALGWARPVSSSVGARDHAPNAADCCRSAGRPASSPDRDSPGQRDRPARILAQPRCKQRPADPAPTIATSNRSLSIDTDQLAREHRLRLDRFVDSVCLRDKVSVKCANDDPGMVIYVRVQTNKVLAVQCDHRTLFAFRKRQDRFVGNCACRPTSVLDGRHIVTQPPKFLNDREREVLVAVESR